MLRFALIICVAPGFLGGEAFAADSPLFNANIRPILKANCFECHGEGDRLKADLDLRLRRFIAKGGESGSSILEGKPEKSPLFEKVKSGEMPPGKKKLTAAEIEAIRAWIAGGARVEGAEPETLGRGFQITDEDRQWWAFQPIKRPPVPDLKSKIETPQSKVDNPIDRFLLAKLSDKGLSFAPPADRLTLLRRVTFDLIGLPPTPEEVDAFLKDASPDAYETVIERLLASPHYGERWGRHWLDVAGYADSEGGSPEDPVRATAWRYRDYVIRSFNADKPFDQFIREQLAGDEMVKPPYPKLPPDDLDKLIATGFLRMAPDPSGVPGIDQKLARNQVVNDTVKVISSAFLGVTVGCAQCHNHRYDPIPQADFYRLRAALAPAYDLTAWRVPAGREVSLYGDEDKKLSAAVEAEAAVIDKDRLKKQAEFIETTFQKELAKLPMAIREPARIARNTPEAKRSAEQKKLMREHPSLNVDAGSLYLYDSKAAAALKKLADGSASLRAKKPTETFVRVLTEVPGKEPPTFLFHRGDPDQPKEKIAPGGLNILDVGLPMRVPEKSTGQGTSGRRLALANWLTDPKHPLTSRTLVNRIWMHHFGKGLVATPGDFGRLGERPTHPELLDWLAAEFMANKWSVKHLHRLILTSTAYRQSSKIRNAEFGIRNEKLQHALAVVVGSPVFTPRSAFRIPNSQIRNEKLQHALSTIIGVPAFIPHSEFRIPHYVDMDNKLLGHFPLRRLEAEALRDAMLSVSGKLNPKMFGAPVPVVEDDAGIIIIGRPNRDAAYRLGDESVPAGEESRRSVYIQVRRSKPLNVLDTFDWARVEPNCEARNSSTSTPQSLMLMNGEFVIHQAEFFAERVRRDAGTDPSSQVSRAWKLAYGSEPNDTERAAALAFLKETTAAFAKQPVPPKAAKGPMQASSEAKALAALCQALLSSNRFLYVD